MIFELTRENFDRETSAGNTVVLFFRGTQGLDAGQMLAPVAEYTGYESAVRTAYVDADRFPDLAKRYGVVVYPAALILRSGVVRKLMQMVRDPEGIIEAVKECSRNDFTATRSRTEKRKSIKITSIL